MIVLYGKTSAEWWMHCEHLPSKKESMRIEYPVESPSLEELEDLLLFAPFLSRPVHYLMGTFRQTDDCSMRSARFSSVSPAKDDYLEISHNVYASRPELSFMQVANTLSLLDLVEYGSSLCGAFRINHAAKYGMSRRAPLIAKEQLAEYLSRPIRAYGKNQARKALPFIFENAYSPAEIKAAMRLSLPSRLGGFGLPEPRLNQVISLTAAEKTIAQRDYLIADLLWEESRVVVEYDPASTHSDAKRLAKDAAKRNALMLKGIDVITITDIQLRSPLQLREVAKLIARRLGVRFRPRSASFDLSQKELFRPHQRFYWPNELV